MTAMTAIATDDDFVIPSRNAMGVPVFRLGPFFRPVAITTNPGFQSSRVKISHPYAADWPLFGRFVRDHCVFVVLFAIS
jgi:hypothetical protein